jgi:hypothetical protein
VPYTPTTWADDVTPVDAARLNHIETGLDAAVDLAEAALPKPGFGTALPGSPVDGQEFVLTDSLTAPTYSWRFRYVAAKSSDRWIFVGGAPRQATPIGGSITTSSMSAVDLTSGPTLVVPVSGQYIVQHNCRAQANAAGLDGLSSQVTGSVSGNGSVAYLVVSIQYEGGNAAQQEQRALVAGETLKLQVYNGAAISAIYGPGGFSILPVAVGG